MPRFLALVLLVVLTAALAAPAGAVPSPLDIVRTNSQLPPTAPDADFNEPGQSSSWLVSTLHMRGPEKLIATAVALLLLLSLVMFAGMLRHVYGGAGAERR
jgi:hypothetical protein